MPSRSGNRGPSVSCWQAQQLSAVPQKWLAGLASSCMSTPLSGLASLHAATSSPLRGARAAELSYLHTVAHVARWPRVVMHKRLPRGLACLRVDTSSPLCRLHADGVFLPLHHHAVSHRHNTNHQCSLLYVGCAQGSRFGREKRGARKLTDCIGRISG